MRPGLAMLTWKQYALLPDNDLAQQDIAAVNLACAEGLPDAENAKGSLCLERLNYFARTVGQETQRCLPRFRRRRYDYRNSEGYFRILLMMTVLQRQLGVRYNPAKKPDHVPLDTADTFIHGAVLGNGGTCSSLPVVCVAVGRRLGYPLKLVSTRTPKWSHLFVRWDDLDGEQFNIEATSPGLNSEPDDYYRKPPYEVTPDQERQGNFLKSKTAKEELAVFLAARFHCWQDYGCSRMAVEALAWASALAPNNQSYLSTLATTRTKWLRELKRREPPNFPQLFFQSQGRRFPETLPLEIERDILGLEAMENLLRDPEHDQKWWEPLRRSLPLKHRPAKALVNFTPHACTIRFKFLTSTSPISWA